MKYRGRLKYWGIDLSSVVDIFFDQMPVVEPLITSSIWVQHINHIKNHALDT